MNEKRKVRIKIVACHGEIELVDEMTSEEYESIKRIADNSKELSWKKGYFPDGYCYPYILLDDEIERTDWSDHPLWGKPYEGEE